jgi:hypothetical protein
VPPCFDDAADGGVPGRDGEEGRFVVEPALADVIALAALAAVAASATTGGRVSVVTESSAAASARGTPSDAKLTGDCRGSSRARARIA